MKNTIFTKTIAFLLVVFALALPAEAQTGSKRFVNSKANLSGALAEKYVDFSFDYPASWQLSSGAGKPDAKNFVQVQRTKGGEVLESFGVGTFSHDDALTKADMSEMLNKFAGIFAPSLLAFQKLSEGETQIGTNRGYELRFIGIDEARSGNCVEWGRLILLPGAANQNRGVFLIVIAKSLAPELKNIKDVGVKGELPVIFNSFKTGAVKAP